MRKRIHNVILEEVVRVLRTSAELAGAGCGVVSQNGPELAALLQADLDKLDGPALVVTVDDVRPIRARPVKWACTYSVAATEYVPMREERPDGATAIDAVMAAADAIETAGNLGHLEDVTHTTPGDGILNATAKFAGEFLLT